MAQELQFDIRQIFMNACENNDLAKVKLCCEGLGLDVNTKSRYVEGSQLESSGLISASGSSRQLQHHGCMEVVNWLLSQEGIDVNLVCGHYTALTKACYAGNVHAVRRLVQAPDINLNWHPYGDGITAAHMAAIYSAACVEVLATVPGVDWNKKDRHGWTPLHLALQHGDPEAVRTILNIPGVDFKVKSWMGNTVAHIYCGRWTNEGNNQIMRQQEQAVFGLCELAKVEEIPWNEKNKAGDTPLMMALNNQRYDVAMILLRCRWVDPSIADNQGLTPEIFAR